MEASNNIPGFSYEINQTFNPPGYKGFLYENGEQIAVTSIQESVGDCMRALKRLNEAK